MLKTEPFQEDEVHPCALVNLGGAGLINFGFWRHLSSLGNLWKRKLVNLLRGDSKLKALRPSHKLLTSCYWSFWQARSRWKPSSLRLIISFRNSVYLIEKANTASPQTDACALKSMSMPGQQGIQLRYFTDLHRPAFQNLFVKNMKMQNSLKIKI